MTPSSLGSIVVSFLFIISIIALILSHQRFKKTHIDKIVLIKPVPDIKKLRPEEQFYFSEGLMAELDSTMMILHSTCERLMAVTHTRQAEMKSMYRLMNKVERILESQDVKTEDNEELAHLLDDIKKFKETYKV